MATLADLYTLSQVAGFVQKVEVALVTAAIAVTTESSTTAVLMMAAVMWGPSRPGEVFL